MNQATTINIPVNRVEGDLAIRVTAEDGLVTNAWSSGLMFRGFEQIMVGRGALDGLVITPRICGICTTSHLTAAVKALEMIAGIQPPPDAVRVRNLALMTEVIQSDMRQAFLMYNVDFVNPLFEPNPLFPEAVRRYEPFKGRTALEVLRETKKVLGIIAIVGGQWPHSSYMVPGGITSVPNSGELMQCRLLIKQFRNWYERCILGCSLERWSEVQSGKDLDTWLDETESHRESDLGFFIRFARSIGLDRIGRATGTFLSYGAFDLPEGTAVQAGPGRDKLIPAGFRRFPDFEPLDPSLVSEHVSCSWFEDYEGGRHPFEGESRPYATGLEGRKYSWAKAPRYRDVPAETGPLSQKVMAGDLLFTDLIQHGGPSAFIRQLARLVRPAGLLPVMELWLSEITPEGEFYRAPEQIVQGLGYGLTDVSRGANGHWVKLADGCIEHYQIVTPTAWNASPRDSADARGPIEEALIGVRLADQDNPIMPGLVVRSFDPCLVCTVHAVSME
ncbi:MAG: nickel-dependent hydrogenase large subunit [Proteobacteria bacterium]|nr:nickel-dependent hydrogenase large subunit [Pseudomonadota bacterium]